MRHYVYAKVDLREIDKRFLDIEERSAQVNRVLLSTPLPELIDHGVRRARNTSSMRYKAVGIAVSQEAESVIDRLPKRTSFSALVQWILRPQQG